MVWYILLNRLSGLVDNQDCSDFSFVLARSKAMQRNLF